jgi:TetR/AcrR family transcriptional regulator, transcriptional repressor for nem operon
MKSVKSKTSVAPANERLLAAAGRGFRVGGFGGAGVDALAKEAGLTSGAFYAHFGSKAQAFRLAVADGLQSLRTGIEGFQRDHGAQWLAPFVDFYLGQRLADPLELSCALPTLTTDAARGDEPTRDAYTHGLRSVVDLIAAGLPGDDREARAWRLLSTLAGSAAMARAVADPTMQAQLVAAARASALAV